MTDIKLPELPKASRHSMIYYSTDQMRTYAEQAVREALQNQEPIKCMHAITGDTIDASVYDEYIRCGGAAKKAVCGYAYKLAIIPTKGQ